MTSPETGLGPPFRQIKSVVLLFALPKNRFDGKCDISKFITKLHRQNCPENS